jgi:Bacterial Ig domain/Bacterial Ig-like domain/Bacterial Ig-like domain (group 3)
MCVRVGALVLAAAIVGACAGLLPSRPSSSAPLTFVDRALGSPSPGAALVRRAATGTTLAADRRGLAARAGSATIALASRNTVGDPWQRHGSGVTRATSFGRESILFGINRAEQFLTVDRRQGTRTWSWRLDASKGSPRLDPDGGVSFTSAGALAGFHILPVAILDGRGRDITPAGLRWSLARDGSSWILGVRLDDAKLPVPYLIDPIALIAACGLAAGPGGTTSCTAAASTGSSSLGITKPAAAVAGDVLVAQLTVRSTGAITPPTGWSQIGSTATDATAPLEQAVYWHRVDGTEGTPITFSWAGGNADASGGIVTYKGVDPFVGFDQGGSAVTSMSSSGTGATGNPAGLAVTTSAANEMLQAAYGVANGVTVTQTGAQGLVREWTVSSTGGTKVTAGFADGVQAAAGASGNKTATWVTSSLWAAHLFALKNESADGSGTVAASFTTASASQTGLTETLTYTPAVGSLANGDVSVVVPAGWTAPQSTTAAAAGYVTASGGSGTNTIAVTGTGPWTVTVSGVTLNQGSAQTLVLKYGDTSGGGAGSTAPAALGGVAWSMKERSSSRGTLTALAASPTITVYAADGTGTVASSLSTVSGSQAALTETLTYTAPTGGVSGGTLTVAVPTGWTAPATSAGPGFTTSSVGTVSVAGQTITVSGVTRTVGQTVVITYGSGATATAAAGPGAQTWQVKEASTAGSVLTAIAVSPAITIYAPDASGTATTPTTNVSASQTGNTVVFTYTVATGDLSNGAVKLTIPTGWSAPSVSTVAAGYTTSSAGTVAVAAQVVTVSALTLTAGSTVTITYGSNAGGGTGATATATTGAQAWQLQERSTAGGVFTNLSGGSPSITVNAANGSGTLTASPGNISASQTGRTITFTYTAAAGATVGGAVTVTAPAGWSAPSTTATAAGYTTSSTGTVSTAGQTITVSGVTLAGGGTMTIVYGDTGGGGPGATTGSTTGAQTWQAQQKSTLAGVLANLAASPSITVYAADGSGTAASSISVVSAGQSGRTVTLTYTAATGGMLNGSLTVVVPSGWTAPATVAGPGFSTTTVGTLSVSGQTITITGVTRTAGQTVVVTYGSGGTATATSTSGAQTWQLQESSTAAGALTSIGVPPVITVYATDGSGTLTAGTSNVSASQTGNTITFTYTAAAGATSGGTVTLVVPAGWSAPSVSAVAAGYTTSSAGTVAVAGQTITVSALTLAGGATATVTYGSKAGGGAGATATAATGAQTWQGQERSTAAGVLTNLGASPSITINAANGSGTMTMLPANAGNGSTGNTLTFTYTAAAGGTVSGDVTVTAPAGWSAPSTTPAAAGYTTASTGTVSAAGQTITVSGVTLAGGGTMTIVYGSTAGGGPGATAGTTAGANAFQAQERSTAGGVLVNLAASPSVNVYAANGSGTMTTPTANVVNGSSNTIVFTYKAAAAGGVSNGTVTLSAPAGWPAPTAGNTTSSLGARSYAGQTVTVSSVTLAANATFTITYGPATAPTTGGAQTWSTSERSTAAGTLTALAASPSIDIYATDGSGTLSGAPAAVGYGSAGNTETFTYTAAAGGTGNAAVTVVVPVGWSAPSIVSGNAGYTVASTGTVSVAAQTITVSSVTLAAGATLTITYGSGAPGATAPAVAGAAVWQAKSKATVGGVLTNLGSSPSITVAQAPASAITFPAAAGLYGTASWAAGCATAGFCGTATDNSGAGIQKVELTIRQGVGNYWNGSAFSSGSPVFVVATGTSSWSYALPASSFPADGAYTVQTRATDNLNGVEAPSSRTFTIDQTPPSAFSPNAPTAGQAIRNGQAVSVAGGSPTDANGIASVAFKACAGAGACTFAAATVTIGSASVSPYSTTWSSQPADGAYKIVARATDNAGNTTDSSTLAVTVDNTAPVHGLALASGTGAYLAGSTLYFKGDAAGSFVLHDALTDATSGPASIDYPSIATSGWTHSSETATIAPSFASSTYSWSASPSTPSGYVITGHDVAGNSATQSLTFVGDTTSPAGGSISYAGGYTTVASIPITLDDGTDLQSGIDVASSGSELLQRASATLTSGACGGFGSYTTIATHPGASPTDTGVTSGSCYRYRYVVLDEVGNSVTYTSGATVKVDTDAPSAFSLSAPAAGFVTASSTVSATAVDTGGSGIAQLELRYCAGASCSFGAGTTIGSPVATSGFASQAWDLSSLTDGAQYTVVARATDAAGNTTDSAPTTVTLDKTAPTTTDNAPAGSQSSAVTVTLSPGDGSGSGVASTSYRVDGGGWHTGTSVVIAAPADHSNDGSHTIDYASVDNVGNTETTRHAGVTIDTQPPSGAPVDPGSVLAGTVVLSDPSPTDPGAGVASVAFQYSPHGAGTWTTIGTAISAPWSTLFDTTAVADGEIDLREVISDAAIPANVTTIDLPGPKLIDNTAPSSAAVTSPAPSAHVGGTVTLTGGASDAGSGIGQLVFKVNGSVVGTASGSPASVTWDSTSTPDGPVSVTVEAKDVAGNGPTGSSARTIVVDNHPPTVTLHDPGAALRGSVALTTTTSADTTQVTFERSPAGAATWTTIAVESTSPFTTNLDTTLVADGPYDLRAVATDGANVVNSNVVTTRIDNTNPTGAVTVPGVGATIGGTSVTLATNAADGGSGVATVEFRVDGTPVGTDAAAPWTLAWDPSSTPSGSHTIDAVVTDAAGNSITTSAIAVTVDSTPPSVMLTDPGALLSGTVTLAASSPDADTARVDFQISPAGAGTWTTVASDTTPPTPYAAAFDTTTVSDGLYDFRAIAHDHVGNVSTPSVIANRRIDNTPPSLVSATPADGSTLGSASSIAVTASEALASITGAMLDGGATGTPTISGATATLATGPLADGPHTLAGTLVDFAGKTTAFTTHFTIVSGPPPADWPYVEKNALPGATATLTSSDGAAEVTSYGAYSSSTDHLVLRIDPSPPAAVGGGLAANALVYDVSCYWSLTGEQLHSFSSPLEIVLSTGDSTLEPATFDNGSWRPIPLVPTAGTLPLGWKDGYFADQDGIHILTMHLSEFTLLHDRFPPPAVRDVNGVVAADGLTLRWAPGIDPTGPIDQVQLSIDGAWAANFDPTQYETKLGAIAAGDPRTFVFTETDHAGNYSAPTIGLRALPALAGRTLADATQALDTSGFATGTVTQVQSPTPAGTVLAPADVEVRALGSAIDLTVSAGLPPAATPFKLRALAPAVFRPTRALTILTSVAATRAGTTTVTLLDSRGHRLASWRRPLRAGLNHPQLLLPTAVRNALILRPGSYWLSWTAQTSPAGDRANDRKLVRVIVPARRKTR